MPRISIDIDLDDFDIDDLLDELQYRFDTIGKCGQNEILDFCKKIVKVSKEKLFYFDEVSIIDSSKIEYFLANHQHFSEEQLRNMLNNK